MLEMVSETRREEGTCRPEHHWAILNPFARFLPHSHIKPASVWAVVVVVCLSSSVVFCHRPLSLFVGHGCGCSWVGVLSVHVLQVEEGVLATQTPRGHAGARDSQHDLMGEGDTHLEAGQWGHHLANLIPLARRACQCSGPSSLFFRRRSLVVVASSFQVVAMLFPTNKSFYKKWWTTGTRPDQTR
jgi:hypothetical protein